MKHAIVVRTHTCKNMIYSSIPLLQKKECYKPQHRTTKNCAAHTWAAALYKVPEYPPYNNDFALSGYHLSGPLKYTSRGCCFASDN